MDVGPITKRPKARPTPYSKPILLTSDRQSRKRKSLKWQSDEKIKKVHYFEYIADERVNVTKTNNTDINDTNASAVAAGGSSLNNKLSDAEGGKISNANVDPVRRLKHTIEYSPWRTLVLIDIPQKLPSPGWNSSERRAQAERETYVLGAIDLPGQPSTLDEPDQQPKSNGNNNTSTNNDQGSKDDASNIKTIPLDNPEGSYTEYLDMYTREFVNGVRIPSDNPQPIIQQPNLSPFCGQQTQILPGQVPPQPQQLVNTGPNPYAIQDLGAQFQQQNQMPLQFPFQQQQSQAQSFQAPNLPFLDSHQQRQQLQPHQQPPPQQTLQPQQQQPANFDPQLGLTGPIMPWLSYPFNQVNENSHAHLFQRPAT